jgi:hypothetical protein
VKSRDTALNWAAIRVRGVEEHGGQLERGLEPGEVRGVVGRLLRVLHLGELGEILLQAGDGLIGGHTRFLLCVLLTTQ